MDKALLGQPLVFPSERPRVTYALAEVARLRALPIEEYWLAIAQELRWTKAPTVPLEGTIGDFATSPARRAT